MIALLFVTIKSKSLKILRYLFLFLAFFMLAWYALPRSKMDFFPTYSKKHGIKKVVILVEIL